MEIGAIVPDIDGSIVPQGGWIDLSVLRVFQEIAKLGIPMGPATGKNADYARGMSTGMGRIPWSFIIAEGGGNFLELIDVGPPPTFRQAPLLEIGTDLNEFAWHIHLDVFQRRFLKGKDWVSYRPELKETMISLFPTGKDVSATEDWVPYFETIIQLYCLNLKVKRHSDGCIDINYSTITKRLGLQRVTKLFGLQFQSILTVVDGVNDWELAEGTTAIAVSNAVAEIKTLISHQQGSFLADFPDGRGFCQGLFHFASQGSFGEKSEIIGRIVKEALPEVCR